MPRTAGGKVVQGLITHDADLALHTVETAIRKACPGAMVRRPDALDASLQVAGQHTDECIIVFQRGRREPGRPTIDASH